MATYFEQPRQGATPVRIQSYAYAERVRAGVCPFCPTVAPYAVTCGGYRCVVQWRRLTVDDRHYLLSLRNRVRYPLRRRWRENLALAASVTVTAAAFGVLAWPLLRLLIAGR